MCSVTPRSLRTFWWGQNKIHSLFSKTQIEINRTNRYLLQGHQNQAVLKGDLSWMCFGWMLNRGIYDNAGLHKSYPKLKFLYRKNRFLSNDLRKLLCSARIQPHFDYACAAWYPNLNKKYKNKLQVLQNNCIRFCLQLDNTEHIGTEHFDKISCLPIDKGSSNAFLQAFLNSSLKCVLSIWTKLTKPPIKTILLLEILLQNSSNH